MHLDSLPCYYIGHRLQRAGIVVNDMKEKYGTWRVYTSFGLNSIHDVTHSGYAYIQYRGVWKHLFHKTYRLQSLLLKPINSVLIPIQERWYRHVYRLALLKFPTEAEGILMGASHSELVYGLDKRYKMTVRDNITHITWESV